MNPLTIGAPSVVLVEDPSNGISFTSFDVAKDGRLLMTRRADPQPGDEARVVLMQNWLAAIGSERDPLRDAMTVRLARVVWSAR